MSVAAASLGGGWRVPAGWLAGAVLLALATGAARAVPVRGVVLDHGGHPIAWATVSVPAVARGAASDTAGRFTLELPAGQQTLVARQLGYVPASLAIVVMAGMPPLRVTLAEQPVPLAQVNVSTSTFGTAAGSEGPVLRRRDVITTPGAAADVFQALRTLPGVNAPEEGAAIVVRGGSPDETLIRVDGVDVGHPYHYENASGGLFSAFDSYMLKSALFSSGGFPARYGGVLSGVLDLETQDPLDLRTVSVGANLAGGGVSGSWAVVPGRVSLVWASRASSPELLFKLYGSSRTFEQAPTSHDEAGRLLWRYSPTGRLSGTMLTSGDHTRVVANVLNSQGAFDEHAANRFGTVQWSDVIAGRVAVRAHAALQSWSDAWAYTIVRSREAERHAQASVDAVTDVGARQRVTFGGRWKRDTDERSGTFPADSTRYDATAPVRSFDTRPTQDVPGVYADDELRVAGQLYATLGGRIDRVSTSHDWTTDPRAALAWRLAQHQTLRLALGRYHQPVDTRFLDPRYGNPALVPMQADHAIAGYEWASDGLTARLEAWRKRYRGLVTNDAATFYANDGHGTAQGIDAFAQGTYRHATGWASYGFMHARRQELDDPREVTAAFDVPHALTLVGEWLATPRWQLGAHWNWHTGAAFTDVVGRVFDDSIAAWRPVFGEHHAARLPAFDRLDVRVTRLFALPAGAGLPASAPCAAYVEALNVLGRPNALDAVWNADYSQRRFRDSYFGRRLLVAGVAMTW